MSFLQLPIQYYPSTALGINANTGPSSSANTAIGNNALFSPNGGANVAVGDNAGSGSSGSFNTFIGFYSGQAMLSGQNNTFIGGFSGINGSQDYRYEDNSIILSEGYLTGTPRLRWSNTFKRWYADGSFRIGANGEAGNLELLGPFGAALFYDNDSSNYVGFRAPTVVPSNLVWSLPSTDGTSGQVLSTNGSGVLSWATSGGGGGGTLTFNNQTAAYTVVSGDLGKIVNCTANTFTVSLTAAATLGSGFNCWVWNTGTGVITIDPNGAETIDGVATLTLRQGEGLQIVCNGTNWDTGDKKNMRGFAQNFSSGLTRSSASGTNSTAIGPYAVASGQDSCAIGSYSNATGLGGVAIGYAYAGGTDAIAIGGTAGFQQPQANNARSTAIGANSSSQASFANGTSAMSLNGSYASGTDSFAAAVASNSSSYGAKGANSIAIGQSNNSTTSGAATLGGILNTASGSQSVAVGGNTNTASGVSSFATGYLGDTQNVELKAAFGNGFAGVSGSCQLGIVNVKRSTTNATPTVLNVWDSATPNANNMVLLQNNSAFAFSGIVVARQQAAGGTQSAAWRVEGLIRREAGAATTTLVASTVTVISNVPGWTLALSADTTIGALALTATGAAGTNIRWVGNIQTSECIYA